MSSADQIVNALLEADENEDPKDFIERNFKPLQAPDRKHLFVGNDGDLYDTRKPDWHRGPPLRKGFQAFHPRIDNIAQFKATWRARHQSNYQLAFLTDDGAALCEQCVKDNLSRVASSVRNGDRDGWRVVGVAQCHGDPDEVEDYHTECANCNKNLGELG
jgi:hypothetical protein